ncbi:MAG: transcriptional repressor [Chloroflexi bacterium]|nr:transcriptional repressor [Chloroflexota bacterium]
MSCQSALVKELRARGFRFTPQREMILEAMHHMPDYMTAEEIHEKVRTISTRVDIATVYRTLELLQEMGFVNSIETGAKERRYELVGVEPSHPHLVCQSCGKVLRATCSDFEPLASLLEATYGFRVAVDRLSILGRCAACRDASPDARDSQKGQ